MGVGGLVNESNVGQHFLLLVPSDSLTGSEMVFHIGKLEGVWIRKLALTSMIEALCMMICLKFLGFHSNFEGIRGQKSQKLEFFNSVAQLNKQDTVSVQGVPLVEFRGADKVAHVQSCHFVPSRHGHVLDDQSRSLSRVAEFLGQNIINNINVYYLINK